MKKQTQKRVRTVLAGAVVCGAMAFGVPMAAPEMIMGSMAVYAAESGEVLTVDVNTADELIAAMAPDATQVKRVVLQNDIVLPTSVGNAGGIIMMGESSAPGVILDLNGHNLTTDGAYALHVLRGTVKVTGEGVIEAKTIAVIVKGGWDVHETKYARAEFGSGVTLKSRAYGLAMMHTADGWPTAHGTTVKFDGRIEAPYALYVNGSVQEMENPLTVEIGDTAVIQASDTVAYAAGYADWTIGKAEMTGEHGIGMKAGKMTLNGTKIAVDGEMHDPATGGGGMDIVGVVFQVEHDKGYADNVELVVNGGDFRSANGDVFYENGDLSAEAGTKLADIDILAGNFSAGEGRKIFGGTVEENDVLIKGGKFQGSDVKDFASAGMIAPGLVMGADGTVVTKPKPPVKPTTPTVKGDFSSKDGSVTVSGTFFAEKVKVEIEEYRAAIEAFKGLKYAAYDIKVLTMAGEAAKPDGAVKVALKVPKGIDGKKARIYYVADDGKVKNLPAVYKDGIMTFETTHFSIYAIVETKDVTAGVVTGGGGIIDKKTEANKPTYFAPGTGVIEEHGGEAVRTFEVAIVLTGACMGVMTWFMHKRFITEKQRPAEKVTEKPRVFREIVVDFLD